MLVVDALGDGVTRLSVSQLRPPSSSLLSIAIAAAVGVALLVVNNNNGITTTTAALVAAAVFMATTAHRSSAREVTESITIIPHAGFVLSCCCSSNGNKQQRFIALGDVEHAALFETFSRCTIRMTLALVPKNSARPLIVLFSKTRPPTATLVACLAELQRSF